MPCWGTHLYIANELNKKIKLNINEFLLGNVLPDIYSGWIIKNASKIEIYDTSHVGKKTLLDGKRYTLPDIEKFEEENKELFRDNTLLLGYFVHILTDYFFNKYTFQNHYVKDENSKTIGCYLKNGEFLSGNVESVKKYKHLDFSLFSNKKLKEIDDLQIEYKSNYIDKCKQIKTMEIFQEDLIKTVSYLNEILIEKKEKGRNNAEYKIFTEEELEEKTKESIEFLYNKVKKYIPNT